MHIYHTFDYRLRCAFLYLGFNIQGFFTFKGVFAKNERGYRLDAIKKALLIATNLTSICCVYKEKNQFNFKQIIQILQPIVIDYLSPHL